MINKVFIAIIGAFTMSHCLYPLTHKDDNGQQKLPELAGIGAGVAWIWIVFSMLNDNDHARKDLLVSSFLAGFGVLINRLFMSIIH